ncbi:MAG: 6-pyruvoyl trahydropterin synthase family protein [Thermoplasmatota archaeon]
MIRLELNGWDAHIGFSASHILAGHEKCGRIHGHNYAIHARIEGTENPDGVVYDFLPLKRELRRIADTFDHRFLLASGMKGLTVKEEEVKISLDDKRYIFPKEDTVILDIGQVTAEELAKYLLELVIDELKFPDNITGVEIGVDESKGQGAWVRRDV